MKTLLWLDDVRDPLKNDWLNFSPIPQPYRVKWVTCYNDFVLWIEMNGLPDGICFDHDLGVEYHWKETHELVSGHTPPVEHEILYDNFKEKTGYHCAKWLVDYCLDNKLSLPKWNIQSANPVGKENIRMLLTNFEKNNPNQ